jgi:L-seryl-tRNA(Ser) seleniumtransferase
LLLFVNSRTPEGQIKADEFAHLGRKLAIPTMNDAAADVPPVTNLSRFLKLGFDLVIFSGGKGLRGPQSAGLLLGRKDLIEAAALNNNPHGDSLCRTNKVGKEELVAMWAALEHYLKQDHDALWREWDRRVQTIAELVGKVKGVRTERFVPEIANHVPHLRISWKTSGTGLAPDQVVKQLRAGDPGIEIRPIVEDAIEVAVWMLEPGEEQVVGKRLVEILQKS